jgi:hypothetical protein
LPAGAFAAAAGAGAFAAAAPAGAFAAAAGVAAPAAGASSVTAARVVSTLTTEMFFGCKIVIPSILISPAEIDFPIVSLSMFFFRHEEIDVFGHYKGL